MALLHLVIDSRDGDRSRFLYVICVVFVFVFMFVLCVGRALFLKLSRSYRNHQRHKPDDGYQIHAFLVFFLLG